MKTKLFSLFVALITTMSAFAYDFQRGGLYYNITSESTVEVTYQKFRSFDNYSGLTSAVIPESVTYNGTTYSVTTIGDYAFYHCTGLTSVTIPNSVTSIGSSAFSGCSGLTSVTIPNSVTSIEQSAFSGCSGLTSINIPNGVTSIEQSAFSGCSGLTSVTIPNSVTSIESNAFRDCSGLTSITIPNSITSIGYGVFDGCSEFTSVVWNAKNCEVWKDDFHESPFTSARKNITSFTLGKEVDSIPDNLCSCMEKLQSITIPASVKRIGSYAFQGCDGLISIIVESGNTKYDSRNSCNAIIETTSNTLITGCRNTIIPHNVTSIGERAFYGCCSLTSITIPNSVTSIGDIAFYGCSDLTSVTIPNSVTSIGEWAFYGCSGLTSITIPNSVTSIGRYAFQYCSGLTSVTIPNSITSLEFALFSLCSGLTSITIPNSVTSIGGCAFHWCTSLASVTIPDNVTSIGSSAFYSCTSLTSVTIPNSVTNIGSCAFDYCRNLETVTLGSGLQDIEDRAFEDCKNIHEITVYATQVPNVVAEGSQKGTFYGVSKSAKVYVPAASVEDYKNHPVWGLFNIVTNTNIPYVVTLSCDSVQGSVEGSGSYQPNEQITITAKPNTGYRFVQWSDGNTENPRTIVVTSDTTLTAEFEEIPVSEYTVSVVVDPAQHGTVQMTLTAVPDEGYQFTQWSDGNTENPRTILVTENMTLSATFVLSGITTEYSNASAEESQNGTRKVFRNGQMYIIRGEKTYTATGSQL